MAHNPLLGSRISLISKKNIRYEGTLYSINEQDATVALQNVRAFGTEGREKTDSSCTFVAPQDAVHPYLLFRGCDIKDLHVHESMPAASDTSPPTDPAILSTSAPPEVETKTSTENNETKNPTTNNEQAQLGNDSKASPSSSSTTKSTPVADKLPPKMKSKDTTTTTTTTTTTRKGRKPKPPQQMIGSGASLLNRKARGAVEGVAGPDQTPEGDFDFESNLAEFSKVNLSEDNNDSDGEEDDEINEQENNSGAGTCVYTKDDFFDSISCDVLDKQNGIDNRLRGAAERSLNTETFGAVSLGTGRRGGRRNRRGRGGGRGGRGRGFGRGGFDGSGPKENNRWKRQGDNRRRGHNDYVPRRTYGDGGLSRSQQPFAQSN